MVGLVLKRSFDVRMCLRYLTWEYHRKYQVLLKKKCMRREYVPE